MSIRLSTFDRTRDIGIVAEILRHLRTNADDATCLSHPETRHLFRETLSFYINSNGAVQKAKLYGSSSLITSEGYNVHRKDLKWGSLIDVDNDRRDNTLECKWIDVRLAIVELEILKINIPSVSCCPVWYHSEIGALIRSRWCSDRGS